MTLQAPFGTVQRNVLSDQVAETIRTAIASGSLRPGTRLVEREIASRMGVSQAPVREALRVLESEGLVTTVTHKGSFVTQLSSDDVLDLFRMRSALERLAVELLVDNLTPPVLDELRSAVGAMNEADASLDRPSLSAGDYRFHELVVRNAGSERLTRLWSDMQSLIRILVAETDLQAARASNTASRHAAILEAIERGDRRTAQDLMESHVRDAGSRLAAALR